MLFWLDLMGDVWGCFVRASIARDDKGDVSWM